MDRAARATTARVAAALLGAERRTQEELAALAGAPRRVVSYHLGKLERAGLVDAQEGQPRSYAPTAALRKVWAERERAAKDEGPG